MADADILITAGSGTKVDTRTVGALTDEHRQVVCIGDPTAAAQVAVVSSNNAIRVEDLIAGAVTTTAVTSVATAVASNIVAASTTRVAVLIVNDSTQRLYLRFDATLTTTANFAWYLEPGERYEVPPQWRQTAITGVWAAANGQARVTVG